MSMKSKDSKDQLGELSQPEPEMDSGGANRSKRRLLKGVVTTAPVVMAVSSKSALANFCTVSGFLSGNLSNPNSQTYCGGRSPGYWMNHVTDEMRHLSFKAVFGDVWMGDLGDWPRDDHHTPKLNEVLNMVGHEDRYQFGAHAVAAYQNALLHSDYPLSVFDVGDIVSQVLVSGYYTHSGTGRTLDAQEVRDFFFQTFDA